MEDQQVVFTKLLQNYNLSQLQQLTENSKDIKKMVKKREKKIAKQEIQDTPPVKKVGKKK